MADARAKAIGEAQSAADDARSIGHEVFVEEVLTDEFLVKETRTWPDGLNVLERPTQAGPAEMITLD
ncbi:hypothetical protein Syun_012332 [Stephania yunnanensis]|uniref:Uncharacterized protein n=1 Tax=Stephania yunnanensis TaxID=152371 RepID=A0AAP0JZD2_9MAGN